MNLAFLSVLLLASLYVVACGNTIVSSHHISSVQITPETQQLQYSIEGRLPLPSWPSGLSYLTAEVGSSLLSTSEYRSTLKLSLGLRGGAVSHALLRGQAFNGTCGFLSQLYNSNLFPSCSREFLRLLFMCNVLLLVLVLFVTLK